VLKVDTKIKIITDEPITTVEKDILDFGKYSSL